MSYLFFAEDKGDDKEGGAATSGDEEAHGEEATTEELALVKSEEQKAKAKVSAEKDVDRRPPTNKSVSIVLFFSTLAFPRLLTLLSLFLLQVFYDTEQRSKWSGERGAMSGG